MQAYVNLCDFLIYTLIPASIAVLLSYARFMCCTSSCISV